MTIISGFSKFTHKQRLAFLVGHSDLNDSQAMCFNEFNATEENQQRLLSEMIENYIGNLREFF